MERDNNLYDGNSIVLNTLINYDESQKLETSIQPDFMSFLENEEFPVKDLTNNLKKEADNA